MADLPYPEPLQGLLALGRPVDPWPDYPAQYGLTREHVPELLRMALDPSTWEMDEDLPAVYANVHAWRALGQLGAVEAAPQLAPLFAWVDEYDDDWTADDLPEAFGLFGTAAIPVLSEYLADPSHGRWARIAAPNALTEIAKKHPEEAPACAAAMTRTLAHYMENHPDLNADIITDLGDLRQPSTYALVEEAFRADRVELAYSGDWEDFQVDVGLLDKRVSEPQYHPLLPQIRKHVDHGLTEAATIRKQEKKEKNKRKQEKQSRRQNKREKNTTSESPYARTIPLPPVHLPAGYDHTQPGAYSVTFIAQGQADRFGHTTKKSITTHEYFLGVRNHAWPAFERRLWQRNYYEHNLRSDNDLDRVRVYIRANPSQWGTDGENSR